MHRLLDLTKFLFLVCFILIFKGLKAQNIDRLVRFYRNITKMKNYLSFT